MDISKFDFTKFDKEKWEEVLNVIAIEFDDAEKIEITYPIVDGEITPQVKVTYVYEDETDGEMEYDLYYTAFNVSYKDGVLDKVTSPWRKFMFKEFGEEYYKSLKEYLKMVKEAKIQKADEEYFKELEDLNNI